jgi:hypothetical protein
MRPLSTDKKEEEESYLDLLDKSAIDRLWQVLLQCLEGKDIGAKDLGGIRVSVLRHGPLDSPAGAAHILIDCCNACFLRHFFDFF